MTDGATNTPREVVEADPVASLLAVLTLSFSGARTTEDIFTGVSQSMPLPLWGTGTSV